MPQVDDIQNVVVHNQQMASIGCTPAPYPLPADPAEAEGLYTWNGDKIYMGPGCRAVFTVHYGECENGESFRSVLTRVRQKESIMAVLWKWR